MTDKTEEKTDATPKSAPELGKPATRRGEVHTRDGKLSFEARAEWTVLRENDAPVASVFTTTYLADVDEAERASRPITFVFNGGPGAASAYLHLGLVGPRRVRFADDGGVLPPPAVLEDNPDTWLRFTDLVCIDPVGTGFSRSHEKQDDPKSPKSAFWAVKRDLSSMGEVISRTLTRLRRWRSPVVIAGESYGGYRVARLAKTLPSDFGVGVQAAILISPGIELSSLLGSDYDLMHWVEAFPSLAVTAHAHGKAGEGRSAEAHRHDAEAFARDALVRLLAQGEAMEVEERARIAEEASALIGLPASQIEAALGRVRRDDFCRDLLRDQGRFVGRYDGLMTNVDPFPDRPAYQGPDITLDGLNPTFTGGINSLLREEIGVETELDYTLLNLTANEAWKDEDQSHFIYVTGPSMDDLRFGMALSPSMKVLITHGHHDLVTPYTLSDRLVALMKLHPDQRDRVTVQHFDGGHMFYSHEASRVGFCDLVRTLIAPAPR